MVWNDTQQQSAGRVPFSSLDVSGHFLSISNEFEDFQHLNGDNIVIELIDNALQGVNENAHTNRSHNILGSA